MVTIKDYSNQELVNALLEAVAAYGELRGLLEDGIARPDWRHEKEEDLEHYQARIDALQVEMVARGLLKEPGDLSFEAHDDATSQGCTMCGNEWKSLNKEGYCSSCWTIWNS